MSETSHSIANVFSDYLDSQACSTSTGNFRAACSSRPAFYATGYPITEPYWATVKVGGHGEDVLMQCFQRRCLTYTPANPPGWQVEMGNVGRHYYIWRYGTQPPAVSADDPTALAK